MNPFVRLCHDWDRRMTWVQRAAAIMTPMQGDYELMRRGLAECSGSPPSPPWVAMLETLRSIDRESSTRVLVMMMDFANQGAEKESKERYRQQLNANRSGLVVNDDSDLELRLRRYLLKGDRTILALTTGTIEEKYMRDGFRGDKLKNAVRAWMTKNVAEDYGIDEGEAIEMLKEMNLYYTNEES